MKRKSHITSWGSRSAAALFVLAASAAPALAEVCDKGEDDLGLWATVIAISVFGVLVVWLIVCWVYRVWQIFLGLGAVLLLFSGSEFLGWMNGEDQMSQAMVREGCAAAFGGLYALSGTAILAIVLAWAAIHLRRMVRGEELER